MMAPRMTYCPNGLNQMNKHWAGSRPLSCVECERAGTIPNTHFPYEMKESMTPWTLEEPRPKKIIPICRNPFCAICNP